MVWFALQESIVGYEFAPAQEQVQDVVVEGAEVQGVPAKFISPLDSIPDKAAQDERSSESSGEGVPVIDIASLLGGDDESLLSSAQAKEIEQASREWGIFQVVNHGVSSELIQRMSDLALEYFRRPREAREMDMGIAPSSGSRDWIDSMIHLVKPYRPDVIKRRTLPEGYKETMDEYVEEVSKIGNTIRKVLSLGLGLKSSRIDEAMGEAGSVMAVNYYPPCPRPDLVTGLTAHSDVNVLSVLHQNEVEGLQVLKDGRWFTVPATPNTLTVNVSDVLQVMSNDAYTSSEHRVFVNPHSARLSVAVFIGMSGERYFGPLPELLDAEHPPLYRHVNLHEYLEVVKDAGLNGKKNLATLRLPTVPALPAAAAVNETFALKFSEPSSRLIVEPSNAPGNVFTPQLIALGA